MTRLLLLLAVLCAAFSGPHRISFGADSDCCGDGERACCCRSDDVPSCCAAERARARVTIEAGCDCGGEQGGSSFSVSVPRFLVPESPVGPAPPVREGVAEDRLSAWRTFHAGPESPPPRD